MTLSLPPAAQQLLPQHALTALVYRLTRCRTHWLKNLLIENFCRLYQVNMAEAEQQIAIAYPTFNDFFTRALRPGVRPIDPEPDALVSPVDGRVSQIGRIENGMLLQAKGREYSVAALLGGTAAEAERYAGGSFATLYLAPHNYHRIHMPCAGQLRHMRYIPGHLFSVNEASVAGIDQLFARNERLVCTFDGPGRLILCLVGALFVGSMETTWHGQVTPAAERRITDYDYGNANPPRQFEKGDEMGRFNMGSTVILLFEPGQIEWNVGFEPGFEVRIGLGIGRMAIGQKAAV